MLRLNKSFIDEMADLSQKNVVCFPLVENGFDEIDRKIYRILSGYLKENEQGDDENLLYCWYYCLYKAKETVKNNEQVPAHLENFYNIYKKEIKELKQEEQSFFLYRMAVHIRLYFLSSMEKEIISISLKNDDLLAIKRIQMELNMNRHEELTIQLTKQLQDILFSETYFSLLMKPKKEKFENVFQLKDNNRTEFEFTLRSFCHMCFWHYQSQQKNEWFVRKGPLSFLTKHLAKVK